MRVREFILSLVSGEQTIRTDTRDVFTAVPGQEQGLEGADGGEGRGRRRRRRRGGRKKGLLLD